MRLIRIPEHVSLHLRIFGDECVVYNTGPSETHLLRMPAARVLALLTSGPDTLESVTEALAGDLAGIDPDDIAAYVRDAVRQFLELGLLEIVESEE